MLYAFRVLLVHPPAGYVGFHRGCRGERKGAREWRSGVRGRDRGRGKEKEEEKRDLCEAAASVASERFAHAAGRRRRRRNRRRDRRQLEDDDDDDDDGGNDDDGNGNDDDDDDEEVRIRGTFV